MSVPPIRSLRGIAGDATAFNLLLIFLLAVAMTALLLPAYRNYTLHEHSKLAKAVLADVVARQPNWQESHPSQRLISLEDLGYAAAAVYVASDGTVRDSASINSIYRISLSFPSVKSGESCFLLPDSAQTGFVLIAEPIQTQRIDTQCARLCLSSSGQQGISGSSTVEKCWSRH